MNQQSSEVQYSLIYVLHADANYTYHLNGERRKADIDVLNRAVNTARKAKHGEVFIFHQKPERKLLLLIPKKDRVFYHFRNGELVDGNRYSPVRGGLEAEARIYNRLRSESSNRNIFLYFGHEIPTKAPYILYHQSQPQNRFDTQIFSDDLKKFSNHFDLTVLSTCNNGTPLMAESLRGISDYLVASPQNLHLSHLTDKALHQLETNPELPTEELANSIAKTSFDRLSEFLQTMVTVAVYDLSEIGNYITSLADSYENHLKKIQQLSLFVNNVDCRDLPEIAHSIPREGVTLYFKPADFGRRSSATQYSGWGCKR